MNTTPQRSTVLITGGEGLIGSRLVNALLPKYDTVTFDVVAPDEAEPGPDRIQCDLTDDDSVAAALATLRDNHGNTLASVIHLAAYYDFSGEPSPLYRELTVEGTRRLLRGLQSFHVEQFVFSSSLLVMRPVPPGTVLTESSPTQAEWEYPQSKLETEAVITKERGNIPALILRIAGVYDEDCHSIPIAHQIQRIYEKEMESYFFPGNLEQGQSFVHRDDVVDCIGRAIGRRKELGGGQILLIGEQDLMSYGELQDSIGRYLYGVEWPTLRIPKKVAKVGAWVEEQLPGKTNTVIKPWMIDLADAHYPVDPSRAKEILAWVPRHTLRGTLGTILNRLKQDPERWYQQNNLPMPAGLRA